MSFLTCFSAILLHAQVTALFNDRAVGVKEPNPVLINGIPCGKRPGENTLFCLNPVQAMSDASYRDLKQFIQNFATNIGGWEQKKISGLNLVFRSNLSAVIFDPYITTPELLIDHGTGDPFPVDAIVIYLRIPTKNFSLKNLQEWIKKNGSVWFGELITKQFLTLSGGVTAIPQCMKTDPSFRIFYHPNALHFSTLGDAASQELRKSFSLLQVFLNELGPNVAKSSPSPETVKMLKIEQTPEPKPRVADSPDGCRAKGTKRIADLESQIKKLTDEAIQEEKIKMEELNKEYADKHNAAIKKLQDNLDKKKAELAQAQSRVNEIDKILDQHQRLRDARMQKYGLTWNSIERSFEGSPGAIEAHKNDHSLDYLWEQDRPRLAELQELYPVIQKLTSETQSEESHINYEKNSRPTIYYGSPKRIEVSDMESQLNEVQEQLHDCLISIGELQPDSDSEQ